MDISTVNINNFPTYQNSGTWSIRPGLDPSIHTFTMLDEYVTAIQGWGIDLVFNDTAKNKLLTFNNLVVGQRYPTELDYNNMYADRAVVKIAKLDLMDSRHWLKFAPFASPIEPPIRRRWNITKDVYYEYVYDVFDGDPSIIYLTSTLKTKGKTLSGATTYEPYNIKEIFTEVLETAVKTANKIAGVNISYTVDIPESAILSTYNSITDNYPIFNNISIPPEYSNYEALKYLLALPECQNYVFGVNPDGNWYLTYRKDVRTKPLDKEIFPIDSGKFGRIDRSNFRPEKIYLAFPVSYEVETFGATNVIRADNYGSYTYLGTTKYWGPGEFVDADFLLPSWGYSVAKGLLDVYNANEQFQKVPPITPLTQEAIRIRNIKKACLAQDFKKTFRIGSSNPLPIDPSRPVLVSCSGYGSFDRNHYYSNFTNYDYGEIEFETGILKKSVLTIRDAEVSVVEPITGIIHIEGLHQNREVRFDCHLKTPGMYIFQDTHLVGTEGKRFWVKYWTQPVVNTLADLYTVEIKNPYGGVPGTVLYYNAGRTVQMSAKQVSVTSPMLYTLINDKTVESLKEIIVDRVKCELSDVFVGNYDLEGLYQAAELGEVGGTGEGLLPQDWTKIESIVWNVSNGLPRTSIEFFRRIIPDETWQTKRILDAVRKSIARNFGDPYRY